MSLPEKHKYPFDETGENRDNYVYPETRQVTKTTRVIIPKEGGFFTRSMRIVFEGKNLERGIDWKPIFLFEKATVKTNKEVCGGIRILNDKVIGDVVLGYQVVGGFASEYPETLHALMDMLNSRNDVIPFDQLINLPERFAPLPHMHHSGDIVGLGPSVEQLQAIRRAIENLRSHRTVALYRLIGSIHTRVNNFIEEYSNADTRIRDAIEDLKRRVGTDPLITQTAFNEAKRALDRRIDTLTSGTETTLQEIRGSFTQLRDTATRVEATSATITEKQKQIERTLASMDVTASYTGSRTDGQFVTVRKQGSAWVIEQKDPTYIGGLFSRISGLEGKATQFRTELNDHQSRLGIIEAKIPNFDGYETRIAELGTRIDGVNTALSETIKTKEAALKERINTVSSSLDQAKLQFSQAINEVTRTATETKTKFDEFKRDTTATLTTQGSTLTSVSNKANANETAITDLTRSHGETATSVQTLRRDFETYKTNSERKDKTLENKVNSNFQTLTEQINLLSGSSNSQQQTFTQRLTAVETKAGENKTALDGLTTRVVAAERTLNGLNALPPKITQLETTTADQTRQLSTVAERLRGFDTKYNELKTGIDNNGDVIRAHHGRIVALQTEAAKIEPLKTQLNAATTASTNADNNFAESIKFLDTLRFNETSAYYGHYLPMTTGTVRRPIIGFQTGNNAGKVSVVEKTDSSAQSGFFGEEMAISERDYGQSSDAVFVQKKVGSSSYYSRFRYPYSRFQRLEIGVDVQIRHQDAKVAVVVNCLRSRAETTIFSNAVSFDANNKVQVVRKTVEGNRIVLQLASAPTKPNSTKELLIFLKENESGRRDTSEHLALFQYTLDEVTVVNGTTISIPHTQLVANIDASALEVAYTTSTRKQNSMPWVNYTNGQWQRIKMVLEADWWYSDTSEDFDVSGGYRAFFGTGLIRPALAINSAVPEGVVFSNLYVRPIEEDVTLEKLTGLDTYLRKWLTRELQNQQTLPQDSRWDLSRFRIQPGAENFSSVTVDENDNLNVKGVVYYDTVGQGQRGVFAPSMDIAVTESKKWKVPAELDGRVALVTVRAASRNEVSKVIHSCVRQMMLTLTGGTEVPINVGDISSFGTHITVSNAIDYPDAIVGRIESPANSRLINGLVSIKV